MKLFSWADKEDRDAHFGKNVVKAFYTAGNLFDIMQVFGDLTPEILHARKYSKWKAAYIHNCLKRGEQPVPGPVGEYNDETNEDEGAAAGGWTQPQAPQEPQQPTPAPRNVDPIPSFAPTPAIPSQPPAASGPSTSTSPAMDPQEVTRVQKLCKFASSAMDYEDIDTAIKNLTEALGILHAKKQQ